MKPSKIPDNEEARIAALYELNILDTLLDENFDNLTQLAAQICQTPIALVSLIDSDRQWFKSKYGTHLQETPRNISFCSHTILEKEQLIIHDTLQDDRFFDNPAVINENGIRFYAGIPLTNENGFALGTLCVMDTKTREISNEQLNGLKILGRQVINIIDLHHKKQILEKSKTKSSENEEILKNIFNISPVGLLISTIETGEIIMVNDAFEKMIGAEKGSLQGLLATNLYTKKEQRDDLKKIVLKEKSVKNFEIEFNHFEGHTISTLVSLEIVLHQNQKMFLSGFIDISNRKKIENDLLESEHILQNIFNLSPIPLILSKISNGIILMANESLAILIGLATSELASKATLDFYVNLEDRIAIMSEISKKGKIKNYEIPFKKADGSIISCMISTQIIKHRGEKVLLTALVDITERKLIEDALQKSEDNLRTVFGNTQVGYILLTDELEILSFNNPAQDFSNDELTKKLTIGEKFWNLYPSEKQSELKETLKKVLGGRVVQHELQSKIDTSEEKWYDIKFSPVSNKDTSVIGFIISLENITQRKKNEIELDNSFKLVSNQNKRLLNFSYIVSHNLRSHTSNIKSILTLIKLTEDDSEKAEMLQMLEEVSSSLNETILNLNDVVSIQTNANILLEKVNLNDFTNKVIHILRDQIIAKKAVINNNLPNNLTIEYNPAYMESILFNFISNGIKYNKSDVPPIVNIEFLKESSSDIILISDNGLGIDLKKNGDKLFGMYKTFNGNSDAKGIGLFITKSQIEAMGGKVEVTSELNVGTTFKIYLNVKD